MFNIIILLHSVMYQNGQGKRNSTYCSYKIKQEEEKFGEIQKFVECPPLGTVVVFFNIL